MSNKTERKLTNMVHKQTLYIAILVALTFGFMLGAAYTSFKLARKGPAGGAPPSQMPPQASVQQEGGADQAEAGTGARIFELEELLKKDPKNVQAWIELGNTFFDSHRFKDAIEAYEKSLELSPKNPGVLTDLGVMYRRDKKPEKAVECFDKAIQAQPDFETARFNKGIVLMHDLNDLPGAVKAWEELVEINPLAQAPNGKLVSELVQGLKPQQN